jgi:hypothetical protein
MRATPAVVALGQILRLLDDDRTGSVSGPVLVLVVSLTLIALVLIRRRHATAGNRPGH